MVIEAKELMTKTKLADARAQCRITQYKLAEEARVARQVVFNAEKGVTISRISAHAILTALNRIRIENDLEPVGFYDLDWKIKGESP